MTDEIRPTAGPTLRDAVLVLASGSPRRSELLGRFEMPFAVRPADVDESVLPLEDPVDLVRRLALAKAQAVADASPEAHLVVVAADTVVVLDGEVLGKPIDAADAASMVARLVGRTHQVLTGVVVLHRSGAVPEAVPESGPSGATSAAVGPSVALAADVEATEVTMVDVGPAEIAWYVSTGEPMDKAGAYGIQGQGAILVSSIRGSWDNVVGLPLATTRRLLAEVGVDLLSSPR